MSQNKIYYSTNCIEREATGYFFSKDAMRFFKSRILETVYQGPGGVYFVTSEKSPNGPRAYSIRVYNTETRSVSTMGEFNCWTRRGAQNTAQALADGLYVEGVS